MNLSIRLTTAAILLAATAFTANAQPWPMSTGVAVATKFSGSTYTSENPNGYVLTAYDLRGIAAQPVAVNWATVPQYHHPTWTAQHLGEIFGLALDCAGNIYVTATMQYGGHNGQIPYPWGPAGPGGIYKINGITGNIDYSISLPCAGPYASYPTSFNTPSLGNICFDPDHNGGQVFVTNLDDGKIYRVDKNLGSVLSTFDPFLPDGGTPGLAPLGERLWGIAYRANAVYFAVWSRDLANPSGPQTSVWKVNLDAAGNFTGIAQFCFSLPATAPPDPITDMEFNAAGQLLLIQSSKFTSPITIYALFPFGAKMYRADYSGTWSVSTTNYELGAGTAYQGSTPLDRKTSATGGCDWGFSGWSTINNQPTGMDQFVWGGADEIHNGIYTLHSDAISGWQGMSVSGGTAASSVLIDADNVTATTASTGMYLTGDIDVMRLVCPPMPLECQSFSATAQLQQTGLNTGCCATFTIVNSMPATFTSIKAVPLGTNLTFTAASASAGWSAALAGTGAIYTPLTPYIGTGVLTGMQACFTTSAPGPYFIEIIAQSPIDGRFCKDTVQVDCKFQQGTPPSPCIQIVEPTISCVSESATARTFRYCFAVKNTSTASAAFAIPFTSVTLATTNGGTVSPSTITIPPLPYGSTSAQLCVTITITSATQLTSCLSFAPYGPVTQPSGFQSVCESASACIDLPRCASCCDDLRVGVKEPRTKQSSTGMTISSLFTVSPGPFRSVRATIERAIISSTCAPMGRMNVLATFTGGSVTGLPSPSFTPASTSAIFGDVPGGIALSNTPISLAVALPPPPTGVNCRDTVRICVRYEFTDTTCRTCDTTLCYTLIRKRMFIDATTLTAVTVKGMSQKGGEKIETLEQPSTSIVTATMASQTKATITVTSRDDLYRITAIRIAPEGGITITKAQGGTVRDNMATLPGVPLGGSSAVTLDLVNDAKLDRVKFYVMLDVVDVETSDTSAADFIVVGSTAAGRTGDVLDADNITPMPTDVHTYALHFFAGNTAEQTVHRVRITALDSARILAAGPFSDDRTVMFRPDGGDSATRLVPADVGDNSVVRPGAHIRPIYLTASHAANGKLHLGYSTYDSVGTVIADGDVVVSAPVTSIVHDDNGTPMHGLRMSAPVPNPAATSTSFTLHTDATLSMTMHIVDAAGRIIHAALPQTCVPGDNLFIVDIASYPVGTYHIVMDTERGIVSVPLVITR